MKLYQANAKELVGKKIDSKKRFFWQLSYGSH